MKASKNLVGMAMTYIIADGLIRGIAFLLLPLLVVHLSRAEFGTVGGLSALSAFLTQLLSFGLVGAPIRFYHTIGDVAERRAFLGTTLLWSSVVAALATVSLHVVAPFAARWVSAPAALVPLIQLTLWTAWFQVVARTIPLGILRARQAALAYLAVSAVAFLGTLGFVYLRLVVQNGGVGGVVRGLLEGAALTALAAVALAAPDCGWTVRRRYVTAALRFGVPLVPHNVAHWLLGLSDRLLIARFLGSGILGLYHFAYQFASGLQLLLTAINGAVMPRFARVHENSSAVEVDDLGKVTSAFLAATVGITVALCAIGPPLVRLLAPAEYVAAAPYIPWLLVALASFGIYCIPANVLTMSLGRTNRIARVTGLAGVLSIVINVALLPRIGVVAAVVSTAAAYFTMTLGVYWYADRETSLMARILRLSGMSRYLAIGFVAFSVLLGAQTLPAWYALGSGGVVVLASLTAIGFVLRVRLRSTQPAS